MKSIIPTSSVSIAGLSISRMLFLLALTAWTPTASAQEVMQSKELLSGLRLEHPRLLATTEHFAQLCELRTDNPKLDAYLNDIQVEAEKLLMTKPVERKMTGRRLLSVSRKALTRITTLAMAYQLTSDLRFVERAEVELLAVSAFSDWNPAHFLDVSEMAAGVAIGYDWLFEELSLSSKETIRKALIDKALLPSKGRHWWKQGENNWNSVCYGGLTLAALAIAEDEQELAEEVLKDVLRNNPTAMSAYEPSGVYPEGPSYWNYGTTYQCMLIAALQSALGDDFGLLDHKGFLASGEFLVHTMAPSGLVFNFSDGRANPGLPCALYWISNQANHLEWDETYHAIYDDSDNAKNNYLIPVVAALWNNFSILPHAIDQELPRSWLGGNKQPIAIFRSDWKDPCAMYLAVKGGKGTTNHAHLDAGSFVYEVNGIRWAHDLMSMGYHYYESLGLRLFDPKCDRWKVFHNVNKAHNTLTVDGKNFIATGHAKITNFKPLDDSPGEAEIDLSEVIDGVTSAKRRFTFDANRGQVTVQDSLHGLEPNVSVLWTFVTYAKVSIDKKNSTARLQQDEEILLLESGGSSKGEWTVAPWAPPKEYYGEELPGVSILHWETAASDTGDVEISIQFLPAVR